MGQILTRPTLDPIGYGTAPILIPSSKGKCYAEIRLQKVEIIHNRRSKTIGKKEKRESRHFSHNMEITKPLLRNGINKAHIDRIQTQIIVLYTLEIWVD